MARGPAADECMLCGQTHNGLCGGPAPKTKPLKVERVRAEKKPPPPAASSPSPGSAATGEVGPGGSGHTEDPFGSEKARPNLSGISRVRDPEEEQLAYAVTLFAERDMLHHASLTEHRKLIRLPESTVDALIWKQRNRETVERIRSDQRSSGR